MAETPVARGLDPACGVGLLLLTHTNGHHIVVRPVPGINLIPALRRVKEEKAERERGRRTEREREGIRPHTRSSVLGLNSMMVCTLVRKPKIGVTHPAGFMLLTHSNGHHIVVSDLIMASN